MRNAKNRNGRRDCGSAAATGPRNPLSLNLSGLSEYAVAKKNATMPVTAALELKKKGVIRAVIPNNIKIAAIPFLGNSLKAGFFLIRVSAPLSHHEFSR